MVYDTIAGSDCGFKMESTAAPLSDKSLNKSVTRILQHSILQLCNEHIGYSHKLQILGVLCMTVDDEQQELVVKVNNTLKRVSPPHLATSCSGDNNPLAPTAAVVPTLPGGAGEGAEGAGMDYGMLPREDIRTGSPSQMLPPSASSASCGASNVSSGGSLGRRSHGRKGSHPVKVHHVYDEGDLISSDEDHDVLTVIPTDPDASLTLSPINRNDSEYDGTDSRPESPVAPPAAAQEPPKPPPVPAGSAKRKPYVHARLAQHLAAKKASRIHAASPAGPSDGGYQSALQQSHSTVRALLTGAANYSCSDSTSAGTQADMSAQDLSTTRNMDAVTTAADSCSPPAAEAAYQPPAKDSFFGQLPTVVQGLTLPIFVASQMSDLSGSEQGDSTLRSILNYSSSPGLMSAEQAAANAANGVDAATASYRGDNADEACTSNSMVAPDGNGSTSGNTEAADYSGGHLCIKEEPEDEYCYEQNTSMDTSSEDVSQTLAIQNALQQNGAFAAEQPRLEFSLTNRMDGLPTQVPYNTLCFTTSTPSKKGEGLTIKYTATGPITVGANGKNVSQQNRVKDIIVYDDSSPLHLQKGNRIEADYMVDSLGLEGRKRRRRAPDDSLTAEEIAEYLGPSALSKNSLFKCKFCPETMGELTKYLQHTLAAHNAYICHQCGKSFTTKSSLLRHRPIHTGMRRFACSICKKTFYRKDKCKSHIKRHLGGTEQAEVEHYQHVEAVGGHE